MGPPAGVARGGGFFVFDANVGLLGGFLEGIDGKLSGEVVAGRFWKRSGLVLGCCWVAAVWACLGFVLADLFSTISHCPWRDFISFSNGEKETKQRKRLSTDGT